MLHTCEFGGEEYDFFQESFRPESPEEPAQHLHTQSQAHGPETQGLQGPHRGHLTRKGRKATVKSRIHLRYFGVKLLLFKAW